MSAVDRLLNRLAELDQVTDYAATADPAVPKVVLDSALRSIAIQGLSIFEQFLRERGAEWAAAFSHARMPASRLTGGTTPYSERIVLTLPKRFRDQDPKTRPDLVRELAETLTSFSSGNLIGHDLFFAWPGSNVQTADIESMARLLGLSRGWGDLTGVWLRLDPRAPSKTSLESIMTGFAKLRHQAAHDPVATIDPLAVGAVTRNVKLVSLTVDISFSTMIHQLCRGVSAPGQLAACPPIRKVIRDGTKWPEYGPGRSKARLRHATQEAATTAASGIAARHGEALLIYDGNEVLDWRGLL